MSQLISFFSILKISNIIEDWNAETRKAKVVHMSYLLWYSPRNCYLHDTKTLKM